MYMHAEREQHRKKKREKWSQLTEEGMSASDVLYRYCAASFVETHSAEAGLSSCSCIS